MLERILGTAARVSLLRVLLREEGKEWSLNELAREAGLSTSTAFKEARNLVGVVLSHDPLTKRYWVRETPLTGVLRQLFSLEREELGAADLFETLGRLGSYYLSGSSAIILRGLARDFTTTTDSLLIVCDRRISKLRGALMSLFPAYRLLLVEEGVRPADFVEGEIYFGGEVRRANLAVLEKAVVDALWKFRWEGENLSHALCCLIEQRLDPELLVKYAREKGRRMEGRLRMVMEVLGRVAGTDYRPEVLRPAREERELRRRVERVVEDVLGS
jgi:hypothetical protein